MRVKCWVVTWPLKQIVLEIKSLSAKLRTFDKPSIQRKEKSVGNQELLEKNVGEN